MNHAAKCFELFEDDTPVAFLGVLHQPTRQRLPLKRVTRIVVLPDYQGIGIGRAFLDAIADLYMQEGFMFEIKTSARNLISSLRSDPAWRTASYGFSKASVEQGGSWKLKTYGVTKRPKYDGKLKQSNTRRSDCKTATFISVLDNRQ